MTPTAPRVGLITCQALPERDPDETLLIESLRGAGVQAEMVAWDRNGAASGSACGPFDLCVIRSTWNYHRSPDAFRSWLRRIDATTRLANPRAVVEWNLHKGYLRDLEAAGRSIVPTAWVGRGQASDLAALMHERGWRDVVIKPAISAGSYRTQRFTAETSTDGQRFLSALSGEADAMIQPYQRSVEAGGERALIWIAGAFTHAVAKSPRFAHGEESVSPATAVSDRERAFGEGVLACVPGCESLLYARLDTMLDDAGELCVSELELIEPSLFLLQHPPALARFVAAIRMRCAS